MWTRTKLNIFLVVCILIPGLAWAAGPAPAPVPTLPPLKLADLIKEGVANNPGLRAKESRVLAYKFKIPQAKTLPDPMLMFGYQNMGWGSFTYGQMDLSGFMFGATQTFPYPGKLRLKGDLAERDYQGQEALYQEAKLHAISDIKGYYYDLFKAYKDLDILKQMTGLFQQVEDAALARYSSGMGSQQEVIMAQTEKYTLLEQEETLKQEIRATDAMLNAAVGRDPASALGRPEDITPAPELPPLEGLIARHLDHSPRIKAKQREVAAGRTKLAIAKKDYYPDFTMTGNVLHTGDGFQDMWSLTTSVNIPIFYKTRQRQAVNEANASLEEARYDLGTERYLLASKITGDYSAAKSAERVMDLYKNALIPKGEQDFESALSEYRTGKLDALTAINRLKALLEFDLQYWDQFAQREKAVARLEAVSGSLTGEAGAGK